MKTRVKPWALFTAAGIFYIWYLVSGVLLNCTPLADTLEGTAGKIFNFCTHFYINAEFFVQIHGVTLPMVFAIYTIAVVLAYKPFTKAQKIIFALLPILAILGNVIAILIGAQMSR